MSMVHADVHGPCYSLNPHWCLWSGLCSRSLFESVVLLWPGAVFTACAVTRKHMEVHDLCSCWLSRARKLLWQWYWCLQISSWKREIWKASVIIPTLPDPEKYQPKQEAIKEISLKVWQGCWRVALHNRWLRVGVWVGKDPVLFKGQATEVWPHFSEHHGRTGEWVWRCVWCEIPKGSIKTC